MLRVQLVELFHRGTVSEALVFMGFSKVGVFINFSDVVGRFS